MSIDISHRSLYLTFAEILHESSGMDTLSV